MDLKEKTKQICQLQGIRPARTKGQNFLIKEHIYDKMIEMAEIGKQDMVLEVGPGLGFLTEKLAEQAGKVISVELDDKLAAHLKDVFRTQGVGNVDIYNQNILDWQVDNHELNSGKKLLDNGKYKIVANIPYNITSVFLRKFLSAKNKPEKMVLMVQKEVAERIVAEPGKMSLLAVSVQYFSEPRIVEVVPASYFWPEPQIDSAIIELKVKELKLKAEQEKDFFRLVKIGFSAKRKMLKKNLVNGYHEDQEKIVKRLKLANINENTRAQELSLEKWIALLEYFV